jgi:biotin operon repressor
MDDDWGSVPFEVRDRRGGFLWVSNDVFDNYAPKLQHSTFMTYLALARYANNDSQGSHPSQEFIASLVGVSRRTVIRAIQELTDVGLLAVEKVGGGDYLHNEYVLLKPCDNLSLSSNHVTQVSKPRDKSDQTTCHPCHTIKTTIKTKEQDLFCPPSSDALSEPKSKPKARTKKADSDPRYPEFIEALSTGYKRRGWEFLFNGADGKQLKALLEYRKTMKVQEFRICLKHYFDSDGTIPGAMPHTYLMKLPNYWAGPLNQFGKLMEHKTAKHEVLEV